MVFAKLFGRKPKPEREVARSLYAAIVAAARQPKFYRDMGVADNVDGRFDLVVLHLCLVLKHLTPDHGPLKQNLIDIFCADMDANLREIGVGDISVGKKVRRMAEALQGRYEAYDAANTANDLTQALWRNVYRSVSDKSANDLATYVLAARDVLKTQSDFSGGRVHFE